MSKDIAYVLQRLPHRYPFLLVDRIVEMTEETIVGLKNVTINEPFFAGHFPGNPVMPGVLIVEAMAQTGAILGLQLTGVGANSVIYFMGMDKVRFRKPVRPGDQLILKLQLMKRKGYVLKVKAEAFVDEEMVAEAILMATLAPGEDDRQQQTDR